MMATLDERSKTQDVDGWAKVFWKSVFWRVCEMAANGFDF